MKHLLALSTVAHADPKGLRDCIVAILREYTQDLSYYEDDTGVSEREYETVAERIIAEVKKEMSK
jgi:hypothetical protein